MTQTTSQTTAQTTSFLHLVESALRAKGRFPCARPEMAHSLHLRELLSFTLEKRAGGWGTVIAFKDVPGDTMNQVVTETYPSKQGAFMDGAETLCAILTGDSTLPFFIAREELVVAGYGTGGYSGSFIMKMELPWL